MMIVVLKLNVFFTIFVKSIVVCKICKTKSSNDVVTSYNIDILLYIFTSIVSVLP